MISLSCDSSILYHTCDSGEKFGAEMKSTLRTSHSSGNSKAESTDEWMNDGTDWLGDRRTHLEDASRINFSWRGYKKIQKSQEIFAPSNLVKIEYPSKLTFFMFHASTRKGHPRGRYRLRHEVSFRGIPCRRPIGSRFEWELRDDVDDSRNTKNMLRWGDSCIMRITMNHSRGIRPYPLLWTSSDQLLKRDYPISTFQD